MKELSICVGSSCHLKGSYNVIQTFQQLIEEYGLHVKLEFKGAFCMKSCMNKGVSITFDGQYHSVNPENAKAFFLENILPALEA